MNDSVACLLPVSARNNRILHIDGDSFFASCEIALDPKLEGRPVWVGGGRRGDGIVIAANRQAKKFGIKTGTACFEAKRLCPSGVLCRPHYDAYRELSRQMFLILEEYAPTLVPYSIDEGFLDFSTMDTHVWRNTTPTDYVQDMAGLLNRSTVYMSGLQKRFELPACEGANYPDAYLEFFRTVVYLRTFGVSEECLRDLWVLEKKLMTLLHVDSTGSRTWFLDACGRTTHRERRLLLSNFDLGIPLAAREVQTGLDFSDRLPELFQGKEMGEDALRVLDDCLKLEKNILKEVRSELPRVRASTKWAAHLPK